MLFHTVVAFALTWMARDRIPSVDYTRPHQEVVLRGGRRLNVFCSGQGSPTVVLIAGGGEDSTTFRQVQGALSLQTRVCSYDRAGTGFSDPSTASGSSAGVVRDLYALMRKSAIPSPAILVGHSIGGIYAQLFAASHGDDVVGMVLIDPSFVGQDAAITSTFTTADREAWQKDEWHDVTDGRRCLAEARRKQLVGPAKDESCLDDPPDPDPALHGLWDAQLARPATQEALLAELMDTRSRRISGLSPAEAALQRAGLRFVGKPLIVLTAGKQFTELDSKQRPHAMAEWIRGHELIARQSSLGRNVMVPDSSHFIQLERPDAVVRAVSDVVLNVRKKIR